MFRFRLGLCALFLAAASALSVPGTEDARPIALPGGGVLAPNGMIAYVPNPGGGIDALDTASGKLLWQSGQASKPLLATKDRLYAQAGVKGKGNQVKVVALDAETGKEVLTSEPVVFPDWVVVGTTHGRSFASAMRADGSSLLLIWNARAWYAGGAAPPRAGQERARKSAEGVARIDTKTGKVEMLKEADIPKGLPKPTPREAPTAKADGITYTLVDSPQRDPKRPFYRKRSLRATNADGKVLWEREIAGVTVLPPLP